MLGLGPIRKASWIFCRRNTTQEVKAKRVVNSLLQVEFAKHLVQYHLDSDKLESNDARKMIRSMDACGSWELAKGPPLLLPKPCTQANRRTYITTARILVAGDGKCCKSHTFKSQIIHRHKGKSIQIINPIYNLLFKVSTPAGLSWCPHDRW